MIFIVFIRNYHVYYYQVNLCFSSAV